MAQQQAVRATATGATGPLLRGQRLQNPKQMKAFVNDVVGLHLLGMYPYKQREDLVAALEEADPAKSEWGRKRLDYHLEKQLKKMQAVQRAAVPTQGRGQTRPAEGSPSETDLTEGFDVGNNADGALDMTLFQDLPEGAAAEPELEPVVNPRGGRPVGTTLAASRELKKATKNMVDSATKACYERKMELDEDEKKLKEEGAPIPTRRAFMKDIIAEKHLKHTELNPGMVLPVPVRSTISSRVLRHVADPVAHGLENTARGPASRLAVVEELLVAYIEEAAQVAIYMNLKELSAKVADLIDGKEIGEEFADFAAMSRGEKGADGEYILKPQDYEPGICWARNFLTRHAERLSRVLPTALDTTREKWQTTDNFAWWYYCLEHFLVKYKFAAVAPEFAEETKDAALKHVYSEEKPRLVWDEERKGWLMMWDEVGLSFDMADEHDHHNSGFIVAPKGVRAQINAPKSSDRCTLIAPLDGKGKPLPPIAIVKSDDKSSILAASHIQLGVNYFTTDPEKRRPGMPKVTRDGRVHQGFVYQSASGGITPAILSHAIKNVWGPCYPTRSADQVVGSLCDAYGHHWDKEVLDTMKDEFFVAIMGVPNATGLWQVADIENNGILKIKWVQAKRYLLDKKREDKMIANKKDRRVPEGEHDHLMKTDLVILLNLVFAPSHCDEVVNMKTIAKSGVVPFTKCLLEHPEVVTGSADRVVGLAAATDAALAAAGDVNGGALDRAGIRALSQQKREKERRSRNGMTIDDDGVHPDDLGDDEATLLRAMDGVKAKGGSMFSASQQLDNPEGIEFTGDAVRHVAERLAVAHVAKLKQSEVDALLRRAAATTTAGAGGRTDGTRARIPWKAVCEEKIEEHAGEIAAKDALLREKDAVIRELQARLGPLGV